MMTAAVSVVIASRNSFSVAVLYSKNWQSNNGKNYKSEFC